MVAFVGSQAVVAEERLATTKYAAHVYPAGDWEYWNAAEGDPGCAPCCYCDTSPPSYAINYTPDDITWLMAEMQNPQIPSGYAVSSVKVSVMCRFDYDTYEHMRIAARTDGTSWMQETLQIYSTYDCCYRPTNGFDVTALRPNGWTQADLTNLQVRARRDDDWPGRYFRVKAYRVIVEFAPDCNGNLIPDAWDRAHCSGQPWCSDCNGNGVIDVCDISGGTSQDVNGNGIPDECEDLLGDLNCDGAIGFDDINPFVLAVLGEAVYAAAYPDCRWLNADCNEDGEVDFDDINPFVALIGD